MKYTITTDESGYVVTIAKDDSGIDIDISKLNLRFLSCYKLIDGELVFDEEKYESMVAEETKENRIAELQKLLSETDYIQDSFIAGLMSLNKATTFITDLISLISTTKSEYKTILEQRVGWINELKSLKGE